MASRSSASGLGERVADRPLRVPTLPPLLVIAGPTATGKTGLSIRVATALAEHGVTVEIISADSRQVFRGLDIGTAKASLMERAGIPHHGLDLVDPHQPFSVADYAAHARAALEGIAKHDGVAILVGGTGLYLRAIGRGMATDELASHPAIRSRLERALTDDGLEPLVARLRGIAPSAAARVDLRNPRRVVRALEIAEIQGDREPPVARGYPAPITWLGLDLDRVTHRDWIANRARTQFETGLVDEARRLRERHDPGLPAFSAIGYREAWAVIDGTSTLDEAIAEDVRRNVAFAKRQRTWFRSEPDIDWLDAARADLLPEALGAAERLLRRH